MKRRMLLLAFIICMAFAAQQVSAQCSICTKTASQLGEKPARGLNAGILYLMFTPLGIGAFIGVRWWKREKAYIRHANA